MEIVISLLMFLGEPAVLKEHTLMPNLSTCLSKKRIAKFVNHRIWNPHFY